MTTTSLEKRPIVAVTVDIVLFALRAEEPVLLTVSRGKMPFRGSFALPGGFVEPGESLLDAARRELKEETALAGTALVLSGVYDTPGRDPRGPVISVCYRGTHDGDVDPTPGSDASAARWLPVARFLDTSTPVAFDHRQIVRDALAR